jgi:L-threonine kinase
LSFLLRVPGSCGELAQGEVDGVRLHISCPVNRYTWGIPGVLKDVTRRSGSKVRHLLSLIQRGKNRFPKVPMTFFSELPIGKGMASSTADLVAALALYQRIAGSSLGPDEMISLLLKVEPTDGVMLKGIQLFDHWKGTVQEPLGEPPPLEILALEFDGTVDTVAFNESDRRKVSRAQTRNTLEAFRLIKAGIREKSIQKIGAGATLSALSHQNVLKKPYLERLLKLNLDLGGVGVNIAHSGSVIGLLFNPGSFHFQSVVSKIHAELKFPVRVHRLQLRGGGIDWLKKATLVV